MEMRNETTRLAWKKRRSSSSISWHCLKLPIASTNPSKTCDARISRNSAAFVIRHAPMQVVRCHTSFIIFSHHLFQPAKLQKAPAPRSPEAHWNLARREPCGPRDPRGARGRSPPRAWCGWSRAAAPPPPALARGGCRWTAPAPSPQNTLNKNVYP